MSKESERAVSLQDCVDYYAKTGSHDLYMEQIDRCQSRRALLFRLLKSFFQQGRDGDGGGDQCILQ